MRSRCCPCVCMCVCLHCVSPLSLLGNGSVKIPTTSYVYYEIALLSVCLPLCPHNCFVFYAVRAVTKKSWRLFLPRTSCICSKPGKLPKICVCYNAIHGSSLLLLVLLSCFTNRGLLSLRLTVVTQIANLISGV
jgi:hypothetical protein